MEDSRKYGIMKLGDDNYHVWSQRTELWLKKEDLWDVIGEATPDKPDAGWLKRDRQARATIGLLIEDKFLSDIKHETSAKGTWHKIQSTHAHNSLGSRLLLYRKIFSSRYVHGTNMTNHITGILETASKLEDSGFRILDELICSALLGSLPPEYDTLITTIEGKNSDQITIAYVREKILEEHRKKEGGHSSSTSDTRALFTNAKPHRNHPKKPVTCYYCHKVGHVRRDCRLLKNHSVHKEYTRSPNDRKPDHSRLMEYSQQEEGQKPIHIEPEQACDTTMYRALNTRIDHRRQPVSTWIIDTGAADHMCSDPLKLHNIVDLETPLTVVTASGETHSVTQKGDHTLHLKDTDNNDYNLLLTAVLYVPSLTDDLLSIARLDDDNYQIHFRKNESWVEINGKQMKLGTLVNKLYIHTETPLQRPETAYMCGHIWHTRLAHRNNGDIERMLKEDMVSDLEVKPCKASGICTACTVAKMSNMPFSKEIPTRSQKPFQMIHSDLCGPIVPSSMGHNSYILTLTDDFSRYSTIYLLNKKSQATRMIQDFIEKGINKFGRRPEMFFSDGGGEYNNQELDDYFSKKGIRHLTSLPYTPEENGKAERLNRTLLEATRTILKQAKLPNYMWGEIVSTATYLLNLVSHKKLNHSPYELWHNSKPSVKHLRTIGTRCFYLNSTPHKRKLEDRGIPGILIGYGASTSFYRIWNSEEHKVYQSRRVVFEEEKCPNKHEEEYCIPRTITSEINTEPDDTEIINQSTSEPQIRRSIRKNMGQAPKILTYAELGSSSPECQDWFKHRNLTESQEEEPHNEH